MSERSPQQSKIILPDSSEVARYGGGNKNRSYDSYDERLGEQARLEADQLAYKDIINPANVLDLKESIRRRTERELNNGPANLRLDQNSTGIKESVKKELIESYLHTADRNKERVIPDEIRHQLEQMIDLTNKELESMLPSVSSAEPEPSTPSIGQKEESSPASTPEDESLSVPDWVNGSESSAPSGENGNPENSQPVSGSSEPEPVISEPLPPTPPPSPIVGAEVGNSDKASKRSRTREFLSRNKTKLAIGAVAIAGLAGAWFGYNSLNDDSNDKAKQKPVPEKVNKDKGGDSQAHAAWDRQARHEDHAHNKTVEGGFEKGATPEQAGDQLKKFMNHRGEVLSIFMYAAKNGISVDKARAHVGEISQQTKKMITKNGMSLTEYGEDQAKAAQHLIDNAKLSWVSTTELQSLFNSGVLENQNSSGRDDKLVINQAPGFDASVRVLKIELENGNVIYLKGNCANFLWKGVQREVFTTFTHKGRTVTVTVPPSRTPVTPGQPRQPKQPEQPHNPHQPKQPKQPKQPEQPIIPGTPVIPETPPGGLEPKDKTKDINVNPELPQQVGMGDDRVDSGEQKPATPPPAEYTPPPPPVSTEPAPGAEPAPVETPPPPPPPPEEGTGTITNPNNGTVQTPP